MLSFELGCWSIGGEGVRDVVRACPFAAGVCFPNSSLKKGVTANESQAAQGLPDQDCERRILTTLVRGRWPNCLV